MAKVFALLVSALLLFPPSIASAQAVPGERSLYWERIEVEIEVLKDGSLAIAERLEYVFDGAWRGGYRVLSLDKLDSISDLEMGEGEQRYQAGGLAKYQYQLSKVKKGLEVKWRCRDDDEPPFSNARKTFWLRYRVQGGLNYRRDFDELRWKAIFEDRDAIVRHGRVRVHLPAPVEKERLRGDLFTGSESSRLFRLDDQTVAFEGEDIPPHALFEVLLQFPPGLVERHFYWGRFLKERVGPILPLFLPLTAFLALFLLFWQKGRDYRVEEVASYLREPPSQLPPALAGALVDEKADMKEILATIADLGRRGYLEMTDKKAGQWLFSKSDLDLTLRKAPDQALLPFERELLGCLFSEGREGSKISLSDLKNAFYRHLPSPPLPQRSDLRDGLERGLLREGPPQGGPQICAGGHPPHDPGPDPGRARQPARGLHRLLGHGIHRDPCLCPLQEREGGQLGKGHLPLRLCFDRLVSSPYRHPPPADGI